MDEAVQQKVKEETDRLAQQASTPVKETYILVNKGMTSAQVGDMLFQSGVITDRKAFEDEMYKRQLNDKIVAGVHVFKGPQELAQVTSNLTTP
ncbi:hypothetical protein LJK88_22400 [Paenibacillus sp. P26]|nr:hypothetical protein LJK88_22400 [Paenibacillus sp. P26]